MAGKAFYVVGLALVVEGEIVIGVMGCPTWKEDLSEKSSADIDEEWDSLNGSGTVMIAHKGCGTWMKTLNSQLKSPDVWTKCFVDGSDVIHKARFCISDSEKWEAQLSPLFKAVSNTDNVGSNQIHLLRACCGSLCKYLMVASGRASIFILRAKQKAVMMAWDHAAGIICVHEAGGKIIEHQPKQSHDDASSIHRQPSPSAFNPHVVQRGRLSECWKHRRGTAWVGVCWCSMIFSTQQR